MGLLISRFRRPQTTIEILEQIDKDISHLQRNRKANQDKQKKLVATFLVYSVIVYILAAIIFFLLYFPEPWSLRLLYSLPLLLFPFLIWGLKKLLHWYFVKRITSNDLALQSLREKKKLILEDVMETETYKKAREILEKFDPSRLRQLEGTMDSPTRGSLSEGADLRQRVVQTPSLQGPGSFNARTHTPRPQGPRQPIRTPLSVQNPSIRSQNNLIMRPNIAPVTGYAVPPGPPMPRTILSRDRGVMDRMMDYLVGDGPENRYALVCQHCHSHNGMALKEEFEYLSFRCCYCYHLNPARKQRPIAPRLEFFAPLGAEHKSGNLSVKEDSEGSRADDEIDSSDESDDVNDAVAKGDPPLNSGSLDSAKSDSLQPESQNAKATQPQDEVQNETVEQCLENVESVERPREL
ncbi:hypothetical protein Btru_012615 [Bulinus truncatus]|nr:hypothetical protein Btru_012615 [Bulinus truncatus]